MTTTSRVSRHDVGFVQLRPRGAERLVELVLGDRASSAASVSALGASRPANGACISFARSPAHGRCARHGRRRPWMADAAARRRCRASVSQRVAAPPCGAWRDGRRAASAACSAPISRPRTRPASRKRTSALAGCTLTSTTRGRRSRNSASSGMAAARHEIAVGRAHRAEQQPVAHRPAVDEQELQAACRAGAGRQAGEAETRMPSRSPSIASASSTNSRPMMRPSRCSRAVGDQVALARRAVESGALASRQREADVGMRHGEALDDLRRWPWFSARSDFRNFSRAGVAENRSRTSTRVPAIDGRRPRAPPWRRASTTISSRWRAPRAARADRQRATAPIDGSASPRKPSVAMWIRSSSVELGGGVALDRQRQIGGVHADAVIADADQRQAAAGGHDLDARARRHRWRSRPVP